MSTASYDQQAGPIWILLLIALLTTGFSQRGLAADKAEMEKLFYAATGK